MTDTAPPTMYCTNHPKVETLLRCNRCDKPICIQCAVPTPTGYRCKECVRGQQKVYETAKWHDAPVAFFTSALLSFLGSLIAGRMGFFVIFLAPLAGVIIAEAVRLVTRRRRSQPLFMTVAVGALLGGLPLPMLTLLNILLAIAAPGASFVANPYSILGLVWQSIYLISVTTTAYYRIKGIFISR